MAINNRHDKFFRETFSNKDNAIDFVQGILPKDILEVLDTNSLTLDNTTYIDQELDEYFLDIVYSCCTFDKRNKLKISFLFEHKSFQSPLIRVQLLNYLAKALDTQCKQSEDVSLVIPIVLYHGLKKWQVRKFRDYFEGLDEVFYRFVPEFDYLLMDLSTYSNKQIKDGAFKKVSLEIALLIMKNILDEKELAKNLNVFFELGRQYFEEESGLRFLETVFRYISTSGINAKNIIKAVNKLSEKGEELIMTLATELREEGEIKGLLEAIEMGLELKFETEGLELFEKIKSIDSLERIKLIKYTVKNADNLNEVSQLVL